MPCSRALEKARGLLQACQRWCQPRAQATLCWQGNAQLQGPVRWRLPQHLQQTGQASLKLYRKLPAPCSGASAASTGTPAAVPSSCSVSSAPCPPLQLMGSLQPTGCLLQPCARACGHNAGTSWAYRSGCPCRDGFAPPMRTSSGSGAGGSPRARLYTMPRRSTGDRPLPSGAPPLGSLLATRLRPVGAQSTCTPRRLQAWGRPWALVQPAIACQLAGALRHADVDPHHLDLTA